MISEAGRAGVIECLARCLPCWLYHLPVIFPMGNRMPHTSPGSTAECREGGSLKDRCLANRCVKGAPGLQKIKGPIRTF